ncbi:hypothetical protein FIBSPDRAFT_865076 [Athelia psychrophila]|uniref:Uncharacterized protein n=1 Tax=Athelia psychrophila TaxID=1759441 RepID=A0A166G2L2_9AGAM|nr:hypothetical protein FIBSPDRAFT_865076 [Fibularhizoctonia sp. CBS 109695]
MSRALWPRSSRPSYCATLGIDGGDDAVPLNAMILEQNTDSGSGWIPEALKTSSLPTTKRTVLKTIPNH